MKKVALLFAGLGIVSNLFSQQIPQYSQYYINPFIYNPAHAGADDHVNSYLIHRSQFQNFSGAPITNAFTIDGPVNIKNIGLGVSLFNDATDLVNRMGFKSAYSYNLKLQDEMNLRFGLGVGVSETRIDFSKAVVRDVNDPFIMKQVERDVNLDAEFGIAYQWKDLEVGAAVPQMLESEARFETNDNRMLFQAKRHFLGSAKYRFNLIEDKGISAYPLVLVRYVPGNPFSYDINAVAEWENKGWFGVSYKNDYAIGINLGVKINKVLSAGYTYDIITSPIKSYAGMSHEILLGFRFGGKKDSDVPVADTAAASAENQRISDLEGIVNQQKQQIDLNKSEIEKLKSKVDSLKSGSLNDSVAINKSNLNGFVTSGLTAEYSDSKGNKPKAGHYVIIGSFSQAENADKALNNATEKGYKDASVIRNTKTNMYSVYIKMTEGSAEELMEDLKNARKEFAADSWIYHLED